MSTTTRNSNAEPSEPGRWLRTAFTVLLAVAFLALLWATWDDVRPKLPETLVLYGFSTVEDAMREGIFPAFQQQWRQQSGKSMEFVASFAGSGAITQKILQRIPAEVAVLSSKLDARRLLVAVRSAEQELPHGGVLSRTPFVIVVREGNPKGIRDFADLRRDGVTIVHADPTTSGGGQWSILAAYGSAFLASGDRDLALELLLGIWRNVTVRLPDARAARREFDAGSADALITYEQDVIGTPTHGRTVGEIIYPQRTILSEQMAIKLDWNIAERQRDLVDAFVAFLWSEEAQRILVEYGFRSPQEELNLSNSKLGRIESPFTLEDLGGTRTAEQEILEGVWREQVLSQLGTAAR